MRERGRRKDGIPSTNGEKIRQKENRVLNGGDRIFSTREKRDHDRYTHHGGVGLKLWE